ncbi:MAG: ATP synthase F1 subunit gamma [bacterium]|jgi:F-type H+-transporting ATPase subunit gamma
MPTLKEFNVKLTRLRSTRKMTKTMKLVSVNKLRRAQDAEKRVSLISSRMFGILGRMGPSVVAGEHPLVISRKSVKKILVLLITSDRGLCGGFNNNLVKMINPWMRQQEEKGRSVLISFCGRRGYASMKNHVAVERYYEDVMVKPDFTHAHRIARELQAAFVRGRVDEVYLAYNSLQGAMSTQPVVEKIMPMDAAALTQGVGDVKSGGWMLEPSSEEVLKALLPRVISLSVYIAMLSSSVGEHSARMKAMEQASSNADNLIRQITLQRNRARQAAITTELTEIVAGAEALK